MDVALSEWQHGFFVFESLFPCSTSDLSSSLLSLLVLISDPSSSPPVPRRVVAPSVPFGLCATHPSLKVSISVSRSFGSSQPSSSGSGVSGGSGGSSGSSSRIIAPPSTTTNNTQRERQREQQQALTAGLIQNEYKAIETQEAIPFPSTSHTLDSAPAFNSAAYTSRNQHRAPSEVRLPATERPPLSIRHKQMWTNLVDVHDDPLHNTELDVDSTKLWQSWPGNNRPILEGRMLCGPDQGVIGFNIGLILVLSTVFHVWVAARLHSLVIVGGVGLVLLTLYALSRATWTEAGIVPRQSFQKLQHDYARLPTLPTRFKLVSPSDPFTLVDPPSGTIEVSSSPIEIDPITGEKTSLKFCSTCKIFRPARAKHCRDCDNCVEEFDHRHNTKRHDTTQAPRALNELVLFSILTCVLSSRLLFVFRLSLGV